MITSYEITLKRTHLEWGSYRYTNSRGVVYGEGYIPIPANVAYSNNIFNQNGTDGKDIFGENLFYCSSADGLYQGVVRAQGNQDNPRYAKQFSGDKDLKAIGNWFYQIGASVGDKIRVTWTSPTELVIEKI